MKKNNKHAGFTLLELLIVIAIIAILSVALIIVINPAETLKKSRDAQRISDLSTLKTALGIYTTSTSTPTLSGAGYGPCLATGLAAGTSTSLSTASTTVDGTGWIPVNFNSLTGGSPISNLPVDPINTGSNVYWFSCDSTTNTYVISALLESAAYGPGGTDDKSAKDGGINAGRYEVGTNLKLP